jgi:Concanavalin A-like lectin/glucanases superfamily
MKDYGASTNFKGSLDEVRIYNRALPQDEICPISI